MPNTYLAGVFTAAILTFAAAPATAQEAANQNSVEIDISGIDLTSEAGTDLVLTKIKRAAEKACGYRTGPRSLSEIRQTDACVDEAVATAVGSMTEHRARQAALKAEKSG